jgi:hypothetical protein
MHKNIITDEIDKMLLKDQEGLLTMMERGNFITQRLKYKDNKG